MAALGWILNLGFAGGGEAPPVVEETTQPTGGYYPYRKKKRIVQPDEEKTQDKEAIKVIDRVSEAIAADRPKRDDVELALRLALQQQDIMYRAIYLNMALDELEEIEKERKRQAMMIEEENAIIMYAAKN